jgi:hypothetical protein
MEHPGFKFVSQLETVMPELNAEQELQVKEAMEASRRVIESSQWKEVEKKMADVFTSKEKDALKNMYHKELDKINWKQLEEKLAYAYNTIDWDKINLQLDLAVNEMRIDSIQKVYSDAIYTIQEMQQELRESGVESVPDSEISLNLLEKRKNEFRRELNRMKATKNKKIVHL